MRSLHRITRRIAWIACLSAVSAGAPGASPCDRLAGTDPIFSADPTRRVVLLGEIHGTAEAPAAAGRLACEAVERGLPVTVGLEIPTAETQRVEAFLARPAGADLTDGTEGTDGVEALIEGPFWQRNYQDGRSSGAMLDLIVALRRLDAGRERVRVMLFDAPAAGAGRDRAMAERIAAALARPPARFTIVLTGNLHNRMTVGTPFNRRLEPMGYLLAAARPDLEILSLEMTHAGGTAWICTGGSASDCGSRSLGGRGDPMPGIALDAPPAPDAPFHGKLHLGPIHASPPARDREADGSRPPRAREGP